MNRLSRLALPAWLFSAACAPASEAGWDLVKDEGALRIYTREIPGQAIKELKAETVLKTTVEKLVAVYMDGDNHSRWFPQCAASKVIGRSGESGFQVYRLIDNPWPVRDRDYVLAAELTRNPATGEASIRGREVDGALPEDRRAVRMKRIRDLWTFAPAGPGRVRTTYVLHFDPGGDAPAAFINMALAKIGADLFEGLHRQAEGPPR